MNNIYIITGANKGLGEAFINYALSQPDTGAISISRRLSNLQQNLLSNGRFLFIKQDLSQPLNYQAFKKLDGFIKSRARIIFISNAGTITPLANVANIPDAQFLDAINVNIISPVLIVKYLLSHFTNNKIHFINITSGAANHSIANWSVYSASKAFTNRFFDVMKEEYKENKNFNFQSIDPGLIDTEMQVTIRNSDFPLQNAFIQASQNGDLATPIIAVKRILAKMSAL